MCRVCLSRRAKHGQRRGPRVRRTRRRTLLEIRTRRDAGGTRWPRRASSGSSTTVKLANLDGRVAPRKPRSFEVTLAATTPQCLNGRESSAAPANVHHLPDKHQDARTIGPNVPPDHSLRLVRAEPRPLSTLALRSSAARIGMDSAYSGRAENPDVRGFDSPITSTVYISIGFGHLSGKPEI